jgi:ribosome-associated protein
MREILINREPVELYKILKFEGLVGSGGEAKMAVADGLVSVNGEIEMRKRRKLYSGDIVAFNGEKLCLELEK